MKSLSLIQTIVLLHDSVPLSKNEGSDRVVRSAEKMFLARQLAYRALGRNLGELPKKTQILFLLIENMGERACKERKIGSTVYRFTKKEICVDIGWKHKVVSSHVKRLEKSGYLERKQKRYRILQSSKIVESREFKGSNE